MPNIKQIIKGHNNKLLSLKKQERKEPAGCNCRGPCPLNGQCLTPNIVYLAEVNVLNEYPNIGTTNTNNNNGTRITRGNAKNSRSSSNRNNDNNTSQHDSNNSNNNTGSNGSCKNNNINGNNNGSNDSNNDSNDNNNDNNENNNSSNNNKSNSKDTEQRFYIGASENFKSRFRNHEKSFRNKAYENETALSKYIWHLKESNKNYSVKWKILKRTSGFNSITNNCSLCLSEKYAICKFKMKTKLLNKRSELVNKCRHENKHILKYHN